MKNTAYEIFIGALSILSIVILVFVYVIATTTHSSWCCR